MRSITIISCQRLTVASVLLLLPTLISCCGIANQSNQPRMTVEQVRKPVATIETNPTVAQAMDVEASYKDAYFNPNYGYSIVIPKGLTGTSSPPPAPQHGVRIVLSTQPETYIWADGTYNAAEYGSLGEAVDAELELLKKVEIETEVLKRVPMTLQNLQAVQLVVRYKNLTSGETMIQNLIIAIRNRKEETGIIYELGLRTLEASYAEDNKIFEQMIRTWASKPLPR